jgi:hypothetical protein
VRAIGLGDCAGRNLPEIARAANSLASDRPLDEPSTLEASQPQPHAVGVEFQPSGD